ncbi:MAG: preprotein translocase subunit SecG [Candidatus Omnitrophica bacterium]|nr:preprotein translocase subunit SecG [Candidatus Omnitrophota bacterium]MDD5545930.1 preprotein translocase subunit SecG [Candidatus Omnitrophota bacterium]
MFAFLITLHVIACLVLIMVILLQAGKGGGISETFGGSGGLQSMLGTKASSFLTKATAACAVLFLVTSMTLALMSTERSGSIVEREVTKEEKKAPAKAAGEAPQTNLPPAGTTGQQAPNK